MLSKDVCLRCFHEQKKKIYSVHLDEANRVYVQIDLKTFHKYWSLYHCPCIVDRILDVEEKPPDQCPYILEHTVAKHPNLLQRMWRFIVCGIYLFLGR